MVASRSLRHARLQRQCHRDRRGQDQHNDDTHADCPRRALSRAPDGRRRSWPRSSRARHDEDGTATTVNSANSWNRPRAAAKPIVLPAPVVHPRLPLGQNQADIQDQSRLAEPDRQRETGNQEESLECRSRQPAAPMPAASSDAIMITGRGGAGPSRLDVFIDRRIQRERPKNW
jgi:hypothetical protein